MDKPFEQQIKIYSYDTDMNAQLSLPNLIKYFMETAIEHSDHVGYSMEKLMEMNRGWVVLNWVIKMHKYPKYGDNLKIYTWAVKSGSLQATRYFTMEYKDGTVAAEAASKWAFLDLENRHPARFSLEMMELYCYDRQAPFDPGRFKLPDEKEENMISEKSLIVRRSETDTNGHTNNIRYVEWAVDDVPEDIYVNYKAEKISVLYRKECRAGDEVKVKTYMEDIENETKRIITVMTDKEGNTHCKLSAIWRKK